MQGLKFIVNEIFFIIIIIYTLNAVQDENNIDLPRNVKFLRFCRSICCMEMNIVTYTTMTTTMILTTSTCSR